MSAVSDRSVQIARGNGGQPRTQRHGPAEVDEWAFLNTKLSNEFITQQVRCAISLQLYIYHPTDVLCAQQVCCATSLQVCTPCTVEARLSAMHHLPPAGQADGTAGSCTQRAWCTVRCG